jgi:hypothetical protein
VLAESETKSIIDGSNKPFWDVLYDSSSKKYDIIFVQ